MAREAKLESQSVNEDDNVAQVTRSPTNEYSSTLTIVNYDKPTHRKHHV